MDPCGSRRGSAHDEPRVDAAADVVEARLPDVIAVVTLEAP